MVPWRAGYAHGEGNSAAHVKASLMGSSVPRARKRRASVPRDVAGHFPVRV
jgi:hypothetical protein